ncbi:MAG TPA: NAD(P)/FAD-dependent oxidoreductase, partial [Acidimicrobiia bacterium]|nr:NAD(P)/FAD-dependent oxidoreductase [Acidimicrobiia bacterium]
ACLPTKSMIRSANLLQEARRADGFVGKVDVSADWSLVAARVREEITGGWNDAYAVARFEGHGGVFVRGHGTLTGPTTVAVGGVEYEARRGIVIATGSRPASPPIPGLGEVAAWTTRDAMQIDELPPSLLVLGGGAVGCELGQVFARFGVAVTVVEGRDRLLPSEEPEASATIAEAFASEGIEVVTGARVETLAGERGSITASMDDGSHLTADRLLVATGRTVDVEGLGLEKAGISTTDGFIAIDGRVRAAPNIWAVGDVTGVGMFTHVALYQASIAVADILGNDPTPADYTVLPRATFTDPEVGSVGLTEADARRQGYEVDVSVKQVPATFRGWLHRTGNAGVIKLVVDRRSGTLLGATAVGPHGAEVLGMLSVVMKTGTPVSELVDMIYPFPTFYGGVGETLGAYGRGLAQVLDPGSEPMFTD